MLTFSELTNKRTTLCSLPLNSLCWTPCHKEQPTEVTLFLGLPDHSSVCLCLYCVCASNSATHSSAAVSLCVCFVFVQVFVLALLPSHHLQARCLARLVSVSPGDLGGLSVMGWEGISYDDCVLGRDHSTVPGHWDSCEHVVTCDANTAHISCFAFFHSNFNTSYRMISSSGDRHMWTSAHVLTSNHDSADVCSTEVLQHCWGFCLQLVLHDDQTQELHVCFYVIPGSKEKTYKFLLVCKHQIL